MSMRGPSHRHLHLLIILLYFAGVSVVHANADLALAKEPENSVTPLQDIDLWGYDENDDYGMETVASSQEDATPVPTIRPCDITSAEIDSTTPASVRRTLLEQAQPTIHVTLHDIPDTIMAGIHYNYMRFDVTAPDNTRLQPDNFIRNDSIRWTYSGSSMALSAITTIDNDAWVYSCLSPAGERGIFEDNMPIADIFEEAVEDRCVEAVDFCSSFFEESTGSGHLIAPLGVDVFNQDVLKHGITLYVQMDIEILDWENIPHTYSMITDVKLSEQSVEYQCPTDVLHFEKASDVISVETATGGAALELESAITAEESYLESLLKFEFTGNKSFFDSTLGEDSHLHLDSIFIFNFLNNQDAQDEILERLASGTLFHVTPSTEGAHLNVVLNTTAMRSVCERATASANHAQLGCLYREIIQNDLVVPDFRESVRLLKDMSDTLNIQPWLMDNFLAPTSSNIELARKYVSSLQNSHIDRSNRVVLIDPGMRWDADRVKDHISMVERSDNVICVGVSSVHGNEQQAPVRRLLASTRALRSSQRVMSELRLQMRARKRTAVVYNDTSSHSRKKPSSPELIDVRRKITSRLYNRGRSLLETCTRFSKLCDMQEWLEKFNHMKATALRVDASAGQRERRLLADSDRLEQQETLIKALVPLETSHSQSALRQVSPHVQSAVNLAHLAGVGSARWHMLNMTLRFQHDAAQKPLQDVLRDIGGALRLHKNVFGVGVRDVRVASVRVLNSPGLEGGRRLLQVENVDFQGKVVLNLATVIALDDSHDNWLFEELFTCIAQLAAGTSELTFIDEPTASLEACNVATTTTAEKEINAIAELSDTSCGTGQQADADCNSIIGAMLLVGTTLAVDWSAIAMPTHPVALYFTATTPSSYAVTNVPWYTWQLRNAVKTELVMSNLNHIVVQTEDLRNFQDIYFEESDIVGTLIRVWVFADPADWPQSSGTADSATERKTLWNAADGWKVKLNNAAGLNLKISGETFEGVTTFARPYLPSTKQFAVIYDWQLRCFYPPDADDDQDPCIVSAAVMAELETTLKLKIEPLRALAKHVNINYIKYDNDPGHESTSTMRFALQVTNKEHATDLQDRLHWHRWDVSSRFEEVIRATFPDVEFTMKPATIDDELQKPWIMIDGIRDSRESPWILPTHWLVIILIISGMVLLVLLARAGTNLNNQKKAKKLDLRGEYNTPGVQANAGVNPAAGDGNAFQKKRMALIIPPNML
jgi:hypothetical protein